LCSHVFYYIDRSEWLPNLEQLASWLAPEGVLVVVLQNAQTDCMQLLEHFFDRRFDLTELERRFRAANGARYRTEVETVPAHIASPDFESAYIVTEFMLNLLPIDRPPARDAVEEYIREHFRDGSNGYRFSCHQDFLTIRRR